jgi:FKBP-type peptidyl-prolyl cis-trans isomerase
MLILQPNASPPIRMKRLFLLLSTAVLAGCSLSTTEVPNLPSDPAKETYAAALHIDLATFTKTPDGVYYKDIVGGTGPTLTGNPTIQFTYAGLLPNGAIFGQEQQVIISLTQLVPGLQIGMQGMNVGGERMVIIPSALGYGNASGLPFPPNSTILFDVRLDQLP